MIIKGLTYAIKNQLYVSLTNECKNQVLTLMKSRGPRFTFQVERLSRAPSGDEVVRVIDEYYESRDDIVGMGENDLGVCFAGIGEPLERLEVIEDVVEKVRQKRHGVVMRVNTNGLFDVDIAERVSKLRLDKYTVSLASANPEQWREMVQPRCEINNNLGTWCAFVDTLTSNGARVEVTTVEAPNVDVQLARELAMSLGACEFRTREYFP